MKKSSELQRTTLQRVAVAYPSGNATAIVFDQIPPSIDRTSLNNQICQAWSTLRPAQPSIEQCCFVLPPKNPQAMARIEMFGGEFCGNAARSLIKLVASPGQSGVIESSGTSQLLPFETTPAEITVSMPIADNPRQVDEGILVPLEGITHLVMTDPIPAQSPRALMQTLLGKNAYNLRDLPAVGVTYFGTTNQQATFCVWVRDVATMFDETACGSGTSAIAIATAWQKQQSADLTVRQPSGDSITAQATCTDGTITGARIGGAVDILFDGEFTL